MSKIVLGKYEQPLMIFPATFNISICVEMDWNHNLDPNAIVPAILQGKQVLGIVSASICLPIAPIKPTK